MVDGVERLLLSNPLQPLYSRQMIVVQRSPGRFRPTAQARMSHVITERRARADRMESGQGRQNSWNRLQDTPPQDSAAQPQLQQKSDLKCSPKRRTTSRPALITMVHTELHRIGFIFRTRQ